MATRARVIAAIGAIGAIGAPVATARADTPPGLTAPISVAPPSTTSPARWQLGLHAGLRATVLDPRGARFREDARDYGWRFSAARPLVGGSLVVSYLLTPIVDVGLAASWMTATYATGIDPADQLKARTRALALTTRLRWRQGRPFVPEPRVDVGVLDERVTVHGTPSSRAAPFVRGGVDLRLGTPRAGVTVEVGYTMVDRGAAELAPPIGGLDLAIGPYFRF